MDERPKLSVSEIATAMHRLRETAEIPPQRGVKSVEVRDGDLYVEHWATAGTLHQVIVRGEDVLAIDARSLGGPPTAEPNRAVASWLRTMIEEQIDSGSTSPPSFTFDPN